MTAKPDAKPGWVRQIIESAFRRWSPPDETDEADWLRDAHRAYLFQQPLRTRSVLYAFLIILVLLTVWAAIAKVDEITRGVGKVIPSRQVQIIQSVDGGEVSELHVSEGDIVERGQLLVRLDKTRFMSSFRESQVEREALVLRAARLRALAEGHEFEPPQALLEKIPEIVANEEALFLSVRAERAAKLAIVKQQLTQRREELAEIRAKYQQLARSYELANSELQYTKPLEATGAVSKVDLLRLERDVNRLHGERAQARAQVSRIESSISEAEEKISQVKLDFVNRAREELTEVTARVSGLQEGQTGLSDRVDKADIRSPVRGTVKRLYYNTVGGVVLPGKEILEIVPLDDALLLEAKILPKDIAFLSPGQRAVVKFTAYDYTVYGGLDGRIEHISADTVLDEEGKPHYLVRVRTNQAKLADDQPIIPGMVASVDILTGKKTVLEYLLKPILRGKQYALSER